MPRIANRFLTIVFFLPAIFPIAANSQARPDLKSSYSKTEVRIPMRDGKRLFTAIYAPRDASSKYPILLTRTPYGIHPYGKDAYPRILGTSSYLTSEGYIFVYQDVRGKNMSEGTFEDIRPFNPDKRARRDVDEASDAYDTIEWLLRHVKRNNGKVGMWGISYPGFYTSMGLLSGHPALVAASPQAPIADWFIGDDDHHNGALFLVDAFSFNAELGWPRRKLTTTEAREFDYGTTDGYKFFLDLGPIRNAQSKYFHNQIHYWNDLTRHTTYDRFWQARNVLPHLQRIKAAVLTVGGWFDAEDLYGALRTHASIGKMNPRTFNQLVMGPWCHGCWTVANQNLGPVSFGSRTGAWYQENIELPFFNYFLKNKGTVPSAKAAVFFTGTNQWRRFAQWPPAGGRQIALYLKSNGRLSEEAPEDASGIDEYRSDPANPVPYTRSVTTDRGTEYMVEDQRFLSGRSDVLVYQTPPLEKDMTIAGPIQAGIIVSTTGTDVDLIVKLIDVLPPQSPPTNASARGGYEMLLRWEVMRGKFRNSYERPEPFVPREPTRVNINLNDVAHTFLKGHRIMIRIQSSMFPLIDRNPQKFVDIYHAGESDFQAAIVSIYRDRLHPSAVKLPLLAQ